MKVARVISAYDLDSLGDEIEQRWLATGEQKMSLRDLADYFNQRVLEAAIEDSDVSLLDTDVGTLYEQLTADDVSSGTKTRVKRRLDRNGVDIESVKSDFVTHQAIHTYLREYRGVSQPEVTTEEHVNTVRERIQKLQDRSAAVTKDGIESLQREGVVPEGDINVIVDIQILHTETDEQYNVFELFEDREEQ
ncbi:rod-determining factor RdfA [Halorhabdus salina]|uniref:rod-determining factor RdfA n=1 Tax=Halorhabdus salina TaxID=2750670 RepID=UPI002867DD1A|nr:rod-determining factor RdfA [Halorhabdus salina]